MFNFLFYFIINMATDLSVSYVWKNATVIRFQYCLAIEIKEDVICVRCFPNFIRTLHGALKFSVFRY